MNAAPKPRIYLENTPTVERLVPALAVAIGLNESIMLLQIDFWIGQTDNFIDGKYWTYQSVRDMHTKAFPYWSIATINRTVASLQSQGLLHTANYNKRKGDKTRWFALNLEGLKKLGEKVPSISVIHGVFQNETPITQNETPSAQNETTLPEITTENTQKEQKNAPASIAEEPKTSHLPPNAINFDELFKPITPAMNDTIAFMEAQKYMRAFEDAFPTNAPVKLPNSNTNRETALFLLKAGYNPDDVTQLVKQKIAEGRTAYKFAWLQTDMSEFLQAREKKNAPPPKLTYIVAPPPDDDDYVTETKSA